MDSNIDPISMQRNNHETFMELINTHIESKLILIMHKLKITINTPLINKISTMKSATCTTQLL